MIKELTIPLSPPLKWAGGKRWQVPHIEPLWFSCGGGRLVEPFCGGLSVALGLRPERALLNDVNPHLMNFYRCLKTGTLGTIPADNDRMWFNMHRRRFNEGNYIHDSLATLAQPGKGSAKATNL